MGSDLAFVLDASGSIGQENWIQVRNYVLAITATTGEQGNERVAVITFNNSAETHISFDTNQDNLTELIRAIRYSGGLTNTADGLCHLLDEEWRENVLQIAIVMTDGKSNKNSSRCGDLTSAIEMVKTNLSSIIILVVAVGDRVDYEELKQIATSNEGIYNLSSLQNELEIADITDEQVYHICYTGKCCSVQFLRVVSPSCNLCLTRVRQLIAGQANICLGITSTTYN